MSFLKKYKKQFDDVKKQFSGEEEKKKEKEQEHPAPATEHAATPEGAPPAGGPSAPGAPPAAGAAQENLTPAVPPGWVAEWDASANHWVYVNPSTNERQKEHPDPTNYGGQSMPPGGPVVGDDGKPKKDKNGMLIGAAGGLATGVFGKKLLGKAKKKALKQAGMGGHGHGSHGGHGGHGGHEGGSSSSSSSSSSGSDSD